MKAIILAAGYATRLYPLTIDKPKALLPIAGRPILDYITDEVETIPAVDEIIIVSNNKFAEHFENWAKIRGSRCLIKVVNDGTTNDDNKLGAIGDIHLVIKSENIDEDILVIAGDNIFTFNLFDFYNYYQQTNKDCILVKHIDNMADLRRMGVAQLDSDSRVVGMEEKPPNPKSNMAVYASYIYRRETLPLFTRYLEEGNNPDAPGYFPSWLYKQKDIYAYAFEGDCYDIGTPESYSEVNEICKAK